MPSPVYQYMVMVNLVVGPIPLLPLYAFRACTREKKKKKKKKKKERESERERERERPFFF